MNTKKKLYEKLAMAKEERNQLNDYAIYYTAYFINSESDTIDPFIIGRYRRFLDAITACQNFAIEEVEGIHPFEYIITQFCVLRRPNGKFHAKAQRKYVNKNGFTFEELKQC